ncbi:4-(cytidine 5'-diphospho)-2-C-methyl-D-erythritol kinase [Mesobacterium pallidum]|uniref:4-(cytidine 5'-diphospho)-2-C-methyl-D-erythritol kinase n=1 Tax=Mesobacterium pallidum TaxID=2872037 RepID=UPI001EE33942|nr:4-(cytidine 5'-diphospho)-2-C-methyl-D-erythritol kinase [Mesobacterium pallidum]
MTFDPAALTARAKVNLSLHVTGRRGDGYHLLDSFVAFTDYGDRVAIAPATGLSLTVTGPRAEGVPTDGGNLCLRAARLFDLPGVAITLDKHLPAAAGIGGGSADAAAVIALLWQATGQMPGPEAVLTLGADVPVCLSGLPSRMRGIGEDLSPAPALPPLWCVLVNPGVAVPTGAVFQALHEVENPPMADFPDHWAGPAALCDWLADQRNDLQPPACTAQPVIAEVLEAIAGTGALLSRMSGSGATCFGLYDTPETADRAAQALTRPGWWVQASALASGPATP